MSRLRDAGFTLIELLVTLVLASMFAASTFTFLVGQQRVYDLQTKLVSVQQQGTIAMEMLVRFVRAAGSGMLGCVRTDSDGAGADTGAPAPVGALPFTSAPAMGLRAYLSGVGNIRVPPLWITNGSNGAPDTLTIAFGNESFGNWRDSELGATMTTGRPTDPLTWPANPVGLDSLFRTDEFIVVMDLARTVSRAAPLYNDRGCALFQVTGVNTTTNTIARSSGSKWNPPSDAAGAAMVPFDYSTGSEAAGIRHFGTLNWIRFAIRPGTSTVAPALTMERLDQGTTPEVLAEGIADMQIAYACDRNPDDGLLPEGPNKLADEWIFNATGDVVPAGCASPDALRITLVARSITADPLLTQISTNKKPAVEDGAAGAEADQYRYRTMTTTVFPRN